jgi:predicted nuclease of restriction endonuclease-like RecB superfamily
LLSADLLSYSVAGTLAVPHFLGEHDHPWLRVLLEEHQRFIGQPQRELEARLREPLPCESPPQKLRLAIQVLGRLRSRERKSAVPARTARAHVFGEAARTSAPPQVVWTAVAASLGVSREDLQESLFGDLPGEQLVAAPAQPLSAVELALRCNLATVQRMLFRATVVRIEVEGNTRVLVRHAKWRGLICTLARRSGSAAVTVELSGPFALFRNTRLYGRALGELVPLLAWCPRFRLQAECVFHGRRLTLHSELVIRSFPPVRREAARNKITEGVVASRRASRVPKSVSADTTTRDSVAARSKTASSVAACIPYSRVWTASCPAARSPAASRGDSALSMRRCTLRVESFARGQPQQRSARPR